MTTLWDLFPLKLYSEMMAGGYIRRQPHPGFPLSILNYSEKAQYEQKWNDVTLNCRGLIFNEHTDEIVARGFKKFFNWDDSSQPYPPQSQCEIMPKMDGSLGILYPARGQWFVATRGSFTSDQARKATGMLMETAEKYDINFRPLPGYSYLFEIIYPENRIVVDYGDREMLVLLDVLDTDTGLSNLQEFNDFEWPDKVSRNLTVFNDSLIHDIPAGEEGFILHWPYSGLRVKMKSAEYLELHRLIFGMNARVVWERLGQGETWQDICDKLPDEFHGWVKKVATDLERDAAAIKAEAERQFKQAISNLPNEFSRKDFAIEAAKYPLKGYLFMIYDGRDTLPHIWQTLKPSGADKIITISEDVA